MDKKNGKVRGDVEACIENQRVILSHQQEKLLAKSKNKNGKATATTMIEEQEISKQDNDDDAQKQSALCCCFQRRNCFKTIIILLISMLLLAAISLSILYFIPILDNENQCFYRHQPFQQTNYKLFTTKTSYSTSFNYLNQSADNLPNIFSKDSTLKQLNDKLIGQSYCKVRQLHYYGRHAARYPSSKNGQEINKLIEGIKNRIDLTKYASGSGSSSSSSSSSLTSEQLQNSTCSDPLAEFKQWETFMKPELDNLIMDLGMEETEAIARRFKSIYRDMFDGSKSKIEFGVSKELRTAQTALAFLKQFDNFEFNINNDNNNCKLNDYQSINDKLNVEEITNDACYKQFIKENFKENLELHKKCASLHQENFSISHNLNLKEPNRTRLITISISKKLKLNKDDYLSPEETQAIYKVCKYETALKGSSQWCNLFSDNDLKFLEFLSDIEDFLEVFGHPDQSKSACPITSELLRSFQAARQQKEQQTPEAKFYFTHSEVIQRILAKSVDLESDSGYQIKSLLRHLDAGTYPTNRQWRSSLFSPFSANIAFTLYECPNKAASRDESSELKVLASLNEKPILLDGCKDFVCDLSQLEDDSRLSREKRCRMEEICRRNIIIS